MTFLPLQQLASRKSELALGVGIAILFLFATFLLRDVLDGVEQNTLYARYRFRGESKVDSSIVIAYLDDDDIRALGGWPLKRSYYALVISALHDLGAKVIGIDDDISFAEPNREYPEYDDILSKAVDEAGNVVLSGYFKSLGVPDSSHAQERIERFSYPTSVGTQFPSGSRFVSPFPRLLDAANSIGHTNFKEELSVPLFVSLGERVIPSFSFELLRLDVDADRRSAFFSRNSVTLPAPGAPDGTFKIDLGEKGIVQVNFTGGVRALNMVHLVQLLRAYDVLKFGGSASVPLPVIHGKIVIVGILAEGPGVFVSTPFARQFPAVGIHAMVLDNILHRNFLKPVSVELEYVISLLFGVLVTLCAFEKREIYGVVFIVGMMLAYISCSFAFFSLLAWPLPLVRPILTMFSTSIALLFFRHQRIRRSLTHLEREKENIAARLQEKESHLTMLEQELFESQEEHAVDRSTALVEEIRKYKDEIRRLSVQVSDLRAYELKPEVTGTPCTFEGIVYRGGSSMESVVEFVKKIAGNDAAVLILGESGTGKELVAQAIHRQTRRKDRAFIAVNCGALSETLLESELFGHEKGAFTGAMKEKLGRFELADGGTMFLDEIAETSEAFQVKLLRVLQEGEFERVGGTTTKKVDVRIIAATNRDLKKAVAEKNFREDLYYRLNVFTIQLPPLRTRPDDIPLLVEHFATLEQEGVRLSSNVMEILCQNEWKGNVRELQSVLKHAIILARSDHRDIVRMKDLPEDLLSNLQHPLDIEEQVLGALREKNFSRSAISETGDELGGLNRGTVAEYFRGYCFKMFCEQQYDIEAAVHHISQTDDSGIHEKVRKKITEYLLNAVEPIDRKNPYEQNQPAVRSKFKNLPQRYHNYLEEVLLSYHQGRWTLDKK